MISAIVAVSLNLVIGNKGKIPWHVKRDLQRVKELTTGHPIIMGRKTYESIGRPLPNRTNIIITRDKDYVAEGIVITHSLEEALLQAQAYPGAEEIFIFGGEQIFREAFLKNIIDRVYLTVVKKHVVGDAYFPEEFIRDFKIIETEEHAKYDFSIIETNKK